MSRLAVRGRAERGQALTEFALVTPLLALLLFGIIQFGFLIGGQVGLTNAAREAARYASTYQVTDFATRISTVTTNLVDNVLPRSVFGYRSANLVAATVTYCAYPNANDSATDPNYSVRVNVTIQYRHPIFFPFFGDGLAATASESMRVETLQLSPPFPAEVSPTCP